MCDLLCAIIIILCGNCLASNIRTSQHFSLARQMENKQYTLNFGSCRIVINPQCPDPDIKFFMYSKAHPENPEQILMTSKLRKNNLARTAFDPSKPTKLIIHGYNSDMFLNALTELRKEYLKTKDYNIFTVDWSPLNQSPCYSGAVWNARHVGVCTAQLVQELRDMGATDIHVIGFSLGAHISNYLSIALRPYKLPKITGLDPALPGYITTNRDEKLDKSDAEFVDVYHTNAFMQGKVEESGHVDFYFNGGAVQPGCWTEQSFFSCSHHRAPLYFAESINSEVGFWGWQCRTYIDYILGRCPPGKMERILIGANISEYFKGVFMIVTGDAPPYALGNFDARNVSVKTSSEVDKLLLLKKYRQDFMEDDLFDGQSELNILDLI